MPTQATELLPVVGGPGRRARLVPVLCALTIGGSWLTLVGFCTAYVFPG